MDGIGGGGGSGAEVLLSAEEAAVDSRAILVNVVLMPWISLEPHALVCSFTCFFRSLQFA